VLPFFSLIPPAALKLVKVKWSCYRLGVAQRVGRGITVLFYDYGTRRGWVVSSTPRPHFTPGKDPVPNLQKAGWAPGPVWTGGKSGTIQPVVSRYTDWATRPTLKLLHTRILQTAYYQAVNTALKASLRLTTFIPNFFHMLLNETEERTAFWFITLWIQTKYCNQRTSSNICLQCYMYRFNDHHPTFLHKNLQKFR